MLSQTIQTFPVWKTIRLGTGLKTAEDFREALDKNGYRISDWGNNVLDKFPVDDQEVKMDLVNLLVMELGFPEEGAFHKDIFSKALELGLELCPAEVGPQLCIQFIFWQKGKWLIMGMDPLIDSSGNPIIFRIGRGYDGENWLYGRIGGPSSFAGGGDRFAFIQPRR